MDELMDTNNKYIWTEHVTPSSIAVIPTQDEEKTDLTAEQEEFVEVKRRKISLTEAEHKQAAMRQKQFSNPDIEQELTDDEQIFAPLLDDLDDSGDSLIEIISDLENSDLDIEITELAKNKVGAEQQIGNKLAKIGILAQRQGIYLTDVAKQFTKELENLIAYYKKGTDKTSEQLTLEQKSRVTLEENYKSSLHKIEKLEIMLKNKDNSKEDLEEKLQQTLKQVEKLENIVQAEQELRKQADLRTKEILTKAKKYRTLSENEKKQREIAEKQAQKAVKRAREVMSYFFNSAFSEDSVSKQVAGFINENFPEFDSMMLSKKAFF